MLWSRLKYFPLPTDDKKKKLSQMNTVSCLCAINTNIPVMSMWYKCKPKRPDRSESLTQFSQMDTHWGTSVSQ